jgi:MoaA/NifB/PqqE/SkfB family radical SAM enzyme
MNYPELIDIEITNYCNAHCIFCDNDQLANRKKMDVALIEKIIDSFPETPTISPSMVGEPFLHDRFYDIVNLIKSRKKKVDFSTNASLIHLNLDALMLLDSNDKIRISIEGKNKDTYEYLRKGLKWDTLIYNLELLRHSRAHKVIRITNVKEIKDQIDDIVQFWKNYTGYKVSVRDEKPLKRHIKGIYVEKKCYRPTKQFVVNVDGKVCLCCNDRKGILGKLKKDIRKQWEESLEIRNDNYDMCENCNFKFLPL